RGGGAAASRCPPQDPASNPTAASESVLSAMRPVVLIAQLPGDAAGNRRALKSMKGVLISAFLQAMWRRRTQMRSALMPVVVAATMVLAVGLSAASASAATTVLGPGDSIQGAIDAAQPGGTIGVRGADHENVALTTDGITLRGVGAVLEPAPTPLENVCSDPSAPDEVNGVCIVGDVDFDTGTVLREIQNVTVSGFTVSGFNEGITAFGA